MFLVIVSTYSQNQTHWNNLVGTWKYYVGYFECTLILNSDGSYEYSRIGDLNRLRSEGKWEHKKRGLVLNSNKQKPDKARVISLRNDSIIGLRLFIHDIHGEPIVMPAIRIVNNIQTFDTLMTNNQGMFELPKINHVSTVEVSSIGFRKVSWKGNLNQSCLEFVMVPETDDYIYQINEKWKVKKDKLYYPGSKKDDRLMKNRNRINYFTKIKNLR